MDSASFHIKSQNVARNTIIQNWVKNRENREKSRFFQLSVSIIPKVQSLFKFPCTHLLTVKVVSVNWLRW